MAEKKKPMAKNFDADLDSEACVFLISESYNLSLFDLYCTSQAEKTSFSEDFLVEISFSVLKALEYLARNSRVSADSRQTKGLDSGYQGMFRMQNILFDEAGQVKLQEMSNVHFDEFQVQNQDLVFLPPEVLKSGYQSATQQGLRKGTKSQFGGGQQLQLNSSMDVWTLGMILLHCMCLDYKKADTDTFEEILAAFAQQQSPSLINLEEKIDMEKIKREAEESGSKSFSEQNSDQNDSIVEKPKTDWLNNFTNSKVQQQTNTTKFLSLQMLES